MNPDEQDKLWTLLGKARDPKVSPFFASKVIRAVGNVEESQPGILVWLYRRWMVPTAAGVCAAVVLALVFLYRPEVPVERLAAASADPLEEMVAVATGAPEIPPLDSLLAAEDHSIWLENDSSSLF